MQISLPSRLSGWLFLTASAAVLPARAQDSLLAAGESVSLERYVVSASRTPQDPLLTPSSVSLVPLEQLAAGQVLDLRTALSSQPGVAVVNTGSTGGQSTVFMRGANSHQTLFVVDGVRMNDRSAIYSNFLGAADLSNIGRIEILRGPQSTLYGSSAMGGVILIDSVRGCGEPTGALRAMGGSFDTLGASASVSGGLQNLGYSASVGRLLTANDLPENELQSWSYATRLEYKPVDPILIGGTFRGTDSEYEQTGSRLSPSPGFVDSANYLGTLYGQFDVSDALTSRITGGLHRRLYTFEASWGVSDISNTRHIVDWQNTWRASQQVEVVAGANFEWSRHVVNGAKSTDDLKAGYVSATAHPLEAVTLTAGARHDDFKSVGGATTWRSGAAWRVVPGTKLRATYGTGFSAPGSDDRFGVAQWNQLPNPDLQPEKSRGWDVGVDQSLADGKVNLGLTYFQNRFRNLFEWEDVITPEMWAGRTVNRSHAKTSGVEFAAEVPVTQQLSTRFAYTYLDTRDSETGRRLARRPRHTVDGEIRFTPRTDLIVGAGLHAVAGRIERSGAINEDYTTVRVFASYEAVRNLVLRVRVENALDEDYEEVRGYASLPRGVFGSVEWRF